MDPRAPVTRDFAFEIRSAVDIGDGLTLSGYAVVFNQITRIDSYEGRFDEQISQGAFTRGINAGKTPVLMFNHGHHPTIGDMPIGAITQMREDTHGLYIEARLHDNELVKPVRDAIESGAIRGMSFRFMVPKGKETWDRSVNPPLRTVTEVNCPELGPVVYPAYEGTSVGVRSDDPNSVEARLAALEASLGTPTDGTSQTPEGPATGTPRLTTGERARVLRELTLQEIQP